MTMISSARVAATRNGSRGTSRRLSTLPRSSNKRVVPSAASFALRSALRQRFYTTEKILQLRTGIKNKADQPKTLYDVNNEKENCGVGLIASLKSIPSRKIVENADEMLVRMAHRGGVGCDPCSGDGSGEYTLLRCMVDVAVHSYITPSPRACTRPVESLSGSSSNAPTPFFLFSYYSPNKQACSLECPILS